MNQNENQRINSHRAEFILHFWFPDIIKLIFSCPMFYFIVLIVPFYNLAVKEKLVKWYEQNLVKPKKNDWKEAHRLW